MSGFYHIWAWRPSWSCDLDFATKLEMPLPKEAPHKISPRSAKRFQRRRSLKLWTTPTDGRTTDGRTDAGSWPSYKLTLSAFGSGELMTGRFRMVEQSIYDYTDAGKDAYPNSMTVFNIYLEKQLRDMVFVSISFLKVSFFYPNT